MDFKKNYKIRLSLLIYLGDVNFKNNVDKTLEEIINLFPLSESLIRESNQKKLSTNNLAKKLCLFFIENNQMKAIPKYFELSYHSLSKKQQDEKIVIGDFNCSNPRLIELFKNCLGHIYQKRIILIAQFKDDLMGSQIDKVFNKDEAVLLPEESISLSFFSINQSIDIWKLENVLSKGYLAYNSQVVLEIRKEFKSQVYDYIKDKLIIMDKIENEDYIILLLSKRMIPLSEEETSDNLLWMEKTIYGYTFKIPDEYHIVTLPYIDYEWKEENFKLQDESELVKSDLSSDLWQEVMTLTSNHLKEKETLVFPKTPKNEEMALILSSGVINGECSLEDGNGQHYLIGGQYNNEIIDIVEKEIKGKCIEMNSYKRINDLGLNLLVTQDGYYQIKKLKMEKE